MKRRELIAFLGGAALLASRSARAQQPDRVRRIATLSNAETSDQEWQRQFAAFAEELKTAGWTEGRNIRFDHRFGGGDAGRMLAAAKEIVALKPDVIVARSTPAVKALASETRSIPIVFVSVSDPIGEKLAVSLARPGGNITGFTNLEAQMGGKWVELLKEVAPTVRRATVLFNPNVATGGGSFYWGAIETAAASLGIAISRVPVLSVANIETAVAALAQEPDSGLVAMPDPFIVPNRASIITAAMRHRVPAVYAFTYIALEGGLVAYGVNSVDLYRRSADYVDRILKGAQPGGLPIQAPTRFDLVVNLKTAKAMGLKIPEAFLVRADEVIE